VHGLSIHGIPLKSPPAGVIQSPPMRTLQFLPLVLVAGVDGFVLFVPYLALIGVAAVVIARVKAQPQAVPVKN
jgi:hypothetical protein